MRMIHWLLGVLTTVNVALGQTPITPPNLYTSKKGTAIQWLITAGFLVGSLVVAFKPAKRSKLE